MPSRCAWLVCSTSLALLVAMPLGAALVPERFAALLAKDSADGATGLVEHLTVAVLLAGLSAGAWALLARRVTHAPARAWLLLWLLAVLYFAGEEASWGQWYFGWETPAALAELNDQGEANLHNTSSWLDQKPRALVELFVLLAGVVAPLARRAGWRRGAAADAPRWDEWVTAPDALLPAALPFVLVRVAGWVPGTGALGDSELRELALAWFLAWYLASFAVRGTRGTAASAPLSAPSRPGCWPPARGSA
jgi:hypothetical protein